MSLPLILTPDLPVWVQQLSGILPLCALIEFIDVATKLHIFELNGSVPLWSWPITPAGARLLLSTEDGTNACCLDRPLHSVDLHCIDGRHGNFYPSHSPTTIRLCMSAQKHDFEIKNRSSNMADDRQRKQTLSIFLVCNQDSVMPKVPQSRFSQMLNSVLQRRLLKYWLLSGLGWLCLIGMTITSLMAGLYIASTYLLFMPLTGFVIKLTHGGRPRRLLDQQVPLWARMVVVTSSVNGSEWSVFYGGNSSLNALLNQPLFRTCVTPAPKILRQLTRLFIAGQWVLAIGSSARQDWNAILILLWILFCSCMSTYGYQPEESVQDWLQYECKIHAQRIQAEFSTRRAMLSALLYLNPDSKTGCTDWIDPVLSNKEERREWLSTAVTMIQTGSSVDETMKDKYWWKYLVEGFEMGVKISKLLTTQSRVQAWSKIPDCPTQPA
jgi:hypothetical protein